MIAGRRTYADQFVKLISTQQLPYHFRDEQAHMTYAFTPATKVSVTAYEGRDALNANFAQLGDSADASGGTFLFTWGNRVAGATLSSTRSGRDRTGFSRWLLGDSTTLEQRASWSNFSTVLDLGAGSLTLNNRVNDVRLSGDATAHGGGHDRSLGYDLASYGI